MTRHLLEATKLHPAIRNTVATHHREVVEEVIAAIAQHPIVVVGMQLNPVPRRAKALLRDAGLSFHYMEYGSYFNEWRRRNALKMWSGWPTFPMIFIKGELIGGADDLAALIQSGDLRALLA